MSKAVLISIRPKWCELIVNGKKTIEIRKSRPKLVTPFKCYIYETRGFERVGNENLNCVVGGNGRGTVIGEFVCDYTQTICYDSDVRYGIDHPNDYGKWLMDASGVTLWEMLEYLDGKDGVYWHISDLVIYDEPKKLSEYRRHDPTYDFSVPGEVCRTLSIQHPPQSWCYVEESET